MCFLKTYYSPFSTTGPIVSVLRKVLFILKGYFGVNAADLTYYVSSDLRNGFCYFAKPEKVYFLESWLDF